MYGAFVAILLGWRFAMWIKNRPKKSPGAAVAPATSTVAN
jgi:hypothetical protein